jgi:hypothetical protein
MKYWNEKPSRLPADTVRRYPRTLQEAFGPHTSRDIQERSEFRWTPVRIALALTYLAALVTLIVVLPGGPR